jgi:hypothetical protein
MVLDAQGHILNVLLKLGTPNCYVFHDNFNDVSAIHQ